MSWHTALLLIFLLFGAMVVEAVAMYVSGRAHYNPRLPPSPHITGFHTYPLIPCLIIAWGTALLCEPHGRWAEVAAFLTAFLLTLMVSEFLAFFVALWMWRYCPLLSVRHEAACHLLATLRDPTAIEEQIRREWPEAEPSAA